LQKAEYSVNGGEWQEVYSDDGISDAAKERYSFSIPLKNPGEICCHPARFRRERQCGKRKDFSKKII
jgi:hypothetical protein